jgi:hypothetical protein
MVTLYKDDKWNTICLPFDLVLEGSPLAGATARALTAASISGTTLNLTFGDAVTTLRAGVPYMIKWASGDNIVNIVSPARWHSGHYSCQGSCCCRHCQPR